METFAQPKPFVAHPQFTRERDQVLGKLDLAEIDAPVRPLIERLSRLPYCFTLQCCYGHFLYEGQPDQDNLQPLPDHDTGPVRYRIAYLAFCLENSPEGRRLHSVLAGMTALDPANIQFGSPDWFGEQHRNSYALQVEPERFKGRDEAIIDYHEALAVQKTRNRFFIRLEELLREWNPE